MAEIGLAASLLGISSFGIKLTTTLYSFASTASSARKQTDFIARHIKLYSEVLDLLGQRIEDEEPIHSDKALRLVDEICEQSYFLFGKIEDLLPDSNDSISLLQKIKWNFKKPKADWLVSELEYLKSTVNLLISVLYAGKKIRTYRRQRKRGKVSDDVGIHLAKAEAAVIEQLNATDNRDEMQALVDDEDGDDRASNDATSHTTPMRTVALMRHNVQSHPWSANDAVVRFRSSVAQAKTPSEQRALAVQNSRFLVVDLLHQWTTLDRNHRARNSVNSSSNSAQILDEGEQGEFAQATSTHQHTKLKDAADAWMKYEESQLRVKELEAELARVRSSEPTTQARASLPTRSQPKAGNVQRQSRSKESPKMFSIGEYTSGSSRTKRRDHESLRSRSGQPKPGYESVTDEEDQEHFGYPNREDVTQHGVGSGASRPRERSFESTQAAESSQPALRRARSVSRKLRYVKYDPPDTNPDQDKNESVFVRHPFRGKPRHGYDVYDHQDETQKLFQREGGRNQRSHSVENSSEEGGLHSQDSDYCWAIFDGDLECPKGANYPFRFKSASQACPTWTFRDISRERLIEHWLDHQPGSFL
jgi:hypothetical protein